MEGCGCPVSCYGCGRSLQNGVRCYDGAVPADSCEKIRRLGKVVYFCRLRGGSLGRGHVSGQQSGNCFLCHGDRELCPVGGGKRIQSEPFDSPAHAPD